jgi:hypothetical protein
VGVAVVAFGEPSREVTIELVECRGIIAPLDLTLELFLDCAVEALVTAAALGAIGSGAGGG